MEQKLVIKAPDENTPGFFKFLKRFALFASVMQKPADHSPAEFDDAIEWLVSMVVEPKNPKIAREIIVNMSAKEIMTLLEGFSAKSPDPL